MHLPNKLLWPFLWSVLAGLALYGASAIASDPQAVWSAVIKLGLVGWLGILALSLANYGLRFGRWQQYLTRLGYRVPPGPSLAYYLGGFAFTTTPGTATAVAATLVCRLATLWFAVAIGLVVVAGLEMRLKRDKAGRLSQVHSE